MTTNREHFRYQNLLCELCSPLHHDFLDWWEHLETFFYALDSRELEAWLAAVWSLDNLSGTESRDSICVLRDLLLIPLHERLSETGVRKEENQRLAIECRRRLLVLPGTTSLCTPLTEHAVGLTLSAAKFKLFYGLGRLLVEANSFRKRSGIRDFSELREALDLFDRAEKLVLQSHCPREDQNDHIAAVHYHRARCFIYLANQQESREDPDPLLRQAEKSCQTCLAIYESLRYGDDILIAESLLLQIQTLLYPPETEDEFQKCIVKH
ncbi:MAG: hypothetical protein CMJ46_08595 [Planctomyces sp.]|nr:hypothetical protein [Planctomyces sp.]